MYITMECILLICWGQFGSDHWKIGQVLSFLFFHQAPCILQMFKFLKSPVHRKEEHSLFLPDQNNFKQNRTENDRDVDLNTVLTMN